MAKAQGRTWWGQRFIAALEQQMDPGRLQRGRSYAGPNRILHFDIDTQGRVAATVRGNVNPYFGVFEEPHYAIEITLTALPAPVRQGLITTLGSRADMVSRLLMNEMPDNIDAIATAAGAALLPASRGDFKVATCDCPDDVAPCKHIAGVYYRLARQLDQDPLLLFELRGLPRRELREALSHTPLGEALAPLAERDDDAPISPDASLYPALPLADPADTAAGAAATDVTAATTGVVDPQRFWRGQGTLPEPEPPVGEPPVPAILIKKGGDYPPFWEQDASFIVLMEELYRRVRTKHRQRI